MTLDPNAQISVTLNAQQWNTVLALLSEAPAPWKLSNPLLTAIQSQCLAMDDQTADSNVVQLPQQAGE